MKTNIEILWNFCNMEPIRTIMIEPDCSNKIYTDDKYYILDTCNIKGKNYNYHQTYIYKVDNNNNNGFRFIRSTKTYKLLKDDYYETKICKNGCCLIVETQNFRKKKFLEPTRLEILQTVYAGLVKNKFKYDKNEIIKSDVAPKEITQNIVKFLY